MNEAQGAAGTGEAEQTTPTTQQEPKPEKATLSPLQEAVRKEMGLAAPEAEPPKEEPKEKPGEPAEEPAEEPGAPAEEQPAEGPQEPPTAEGEEEHEEEVPENWPKTAKARVAEEAHKRRERTKERDQWKETAGNLYTQLQQASAQLSSRQLAARGQSGDVLDPQSLEAENHWTQLRDFARANPDGAEDVMWGRDAQGNELRRDYTTEEIRKIASDAENALAALSAKRAVLEREREKKVEANTEIAKKVYPDLFKDSEIGRQAAGLLQRAPWILQSEEWALDVGDYLTGRSQRLAKQGKNGQPLSKSAQAFINAPKVTPAPGVIKSRSPSSGPGAGPGRGGSSVGRVDDKQANEEFYAKGGTSEALEEKIKRKLAASEAARAGGKQAALV